MATAQLPTIRAISPVREMGAYEALWAKTDATFASLAEKFRQHPDNLPSDFVTEYEAHYFSDTVRGMLRDAGIKQFGVRIHRAGEYPKKLRDAEDPVELLYYRGWWENDRGHRYAFESRLPERERCSPGRNCGKVLADFSSASFSLFEARLST